MKASRHNGRSGKHGVYDVKHNDRDFDVENSEHIDPERTKENVYWDCYQGYSFAGSSQERQFRHFLLLPQRAAAQIPCRPGDLWTSALTAFSAEIFLHQNK